MSSPYVICHRATESAEEIAIDFVGRIAAHCGPRDISAKSMAAVFYAASRRRGAGVDELLVMIATVGPRLSDSAVKHVKINRRVAIENSAMEA